MAKKKNVPNNKGHNSKPTDKGGSNNQRSNSSDKAGAVDKAANKSSGEAGDISKPSEEDKAAAKNDPAWYARDPQLLADATRINFSQPFGANINLEVNSYPHTGGTWHATNIAKYAGLAVFNLRPSLGNNTNRNDPVNTAASMLYTNVRYVNSGRKNYDPADLMMYLLSIGDIYSFVAWCKRVYAASFMYSQRNFYIGKAILEGMKVDTSIVKDLANFRAWLNSFINKVSSYALPADIYYYDQKIQLYSSLYIENGYGNLKDQLYMATTDKFYKFDLDDGSKGMLKLETFTNDNGVIKFDDIISMGEALLENIWGDEDFGLMSADIMKAFGGRIIGLVDQTDEAVLVPVFDQLMLEKFRNATVVTHAVDEISLSGVPGVSSINKGEVRQDTKGNIITREEIGYNPSTITAKEFYTIAATPILNLDSPDPDSVDVIESTRLTAAWQPEDIHEEGDEVRIPVYSGVAICESISVFVMNDRGETSSKPWVKLIESTDDATEIFNDGDCWAGLSFKYLPMQYGSNVSTEGHGEFIEYGPVYMIHSLENWTVLDAKILKRMHEVALISMLSTPGVAKMIVGGSGKSE